MGKMNCLITIKDMHLTDKGEAERSELITSAVIEGTADCYTIEYEEQDKEMRGCLTRITVTNAKCIEVVREGAYNTAMRIEEGRHNICCYSTPLGNITMGIYGSKIVSNFNDGRLSKLELIYKIDMENRAISKNRIRIVPEYKED
jgi:uncharacterized beta-barrel protein YwiB (DUF1934 family)